MPACSPSKDRPRLRHPSTRLGFYFIASLALAFVWIPSAQAQTTYLSTTSGNVNAAIWAPPGVPGPADTAIVQGGHTVEFGGTWQVDTLTVQNGGTVIGTAPSNVLQVMAVAVDNGGVLRGIDAPGAGGSLSVTGLVPGTLTVLNNGLMRGGNPYGNLHITDAITRASCSTSSTVTSNGGTFLGGSDGGGIFIVSGMVDLYNATVLGGSGAAPFTPGGQSQAGNIYINGHTILLNGNTPGLTQVLSGSNTTPGGSGGTVAIIAGNCSFPSNLYIGATATVNVGGPSVGGCPDVTLFSSGISTILGTVGAQGSNCAFWDPPDLKLSGDGLVQSKVLTVAGDTFTATGLNGPGLRADHSLSILLSPGSVLDLRGLEPGSEPYFQAGEQLTVCADEIVLDPGVHLEELMQPPPEPCQGQYVTALNLTPGQWQAVQPGDTVTLTLQVTHVGTGAGDTVVRLRDSAGWLQGGPQSHAAGLQPGDSVVLTATLVVPAVPQHDFSELVLDASISGQPSQQQTSVFVVQ